MGIEKRTFPYEILLRLGPGGLIASHLIELEQVVDGDEEIAARELPARPIEPAEIAAILGEHAGLLAAQVSGLTAALAAERTKWQQRLGRAESEKDALGAELRERDQRISAQHAELEAARGAKAKPRRRWFGRAPG